MGGGLLVKVAFRRESSFRRWPNPNLRSGGLREGMVRPGRSSTCDLSVMMSTNGGALRSKSLIGRHLRSSSASNQYGHLLPSFATSSMFTTHRRKSVVKPGKYRDIYARRRIQAKLLEAKRPSLLKERMLSANPPDVQQQGELAESVERLFSIVRGWSSSNISMNLRQDKTPLDPKIVCREDSSLTLRKDLKESGRAVPPTLSLTLEKDIFEPPGNFTSRHFIFMAKVYKCSQNRWQARSFLVLLAFKLDYQSSIITRGAGETALRDVFSKRSQRRQKALYCPAAGRPNYGGLATEHAGAPWNVWKQRNDQLFVADGL